MSLKIPAATLAKGTQNRLLASDRAAHDWYRFVLSFPPHLVREYIERFGVTANNTVLDPFCGTGTTLVECKKLAISAIGIEAHPMAHFASRVKTNWQVDPEGLTGHAEEVAERARETLRSEGVEDELLVRAFPRRAERLRSLSEERNALILKHSISPMPLHKVLVLLEEIEACRNSAYHGHERLALAKALIQSVSNLEFGPEVGVGSPKADAPVVASWMDCVYAMANDLVSLRSLTDTPVAVHHGDSREVGELLEPKSIDAVITSPPYPNEKDYTRTTRLESVLLGFIRDKKELRKLKQGLIRSNTRNVYADDTDDLWVAQHPKIQRIAVAIEARRIELGKTSGFERLYARVTRLYFGGMARHLEGLRRVLRPGAHLAFVVGDQASYLRVMIRTGEILGDIAESLGYRVLSTDLFRTRLATATREQLREEVVVLEWPGR